MRLWVYHVCFKWIGLLHGVYDECPLKEHHQERLISGDDIKGTILTHPWKGTWFANHLQEIKHEIWGHGPCVCFFSSSPFSSMEEDTCPLLRSSISVEFTPVTTAEDIAIQAFFFGGGGGFIFFYVHPYLGKIPILTNIFQMGLKPPTSLEGGCKKLWFVSWAVWMVVVVVVVLVEMHMLRMVVVWMTVLLGKWSKPKLTNQHVSTGRLKHLGWFLLG